MPALKVPGLRWIAGLCMLGILHTAVAARDLGASGEITLHYQQRIPYEYREDGKVQGLWASSAEQVFNKAGVPFRWAETPITRQLALIKGNRGLDCTAGRFRTAERAKWAHFSKPFYRNRPIGLLARSDNADLREYTSLESAIKSPMVRLLIKQGYTYGAVIDGFIAQRRQAPLTTYDENFHMLRQIHRGMADAFPIAEDEQEGLLANTDLPASDFVFLKFPDAPAPELRYIMCSHKVSPQTMAKLNAAIEFKER